MVSIPWQVISFNFYLLSTIRLPKLQLGLHFLHCHFPPSLASLCPHCLLMNCEHLNKKDGLDCWAHFFTLFHWMLVSQVLAILLTMKCNFYLAPAKLTKVLLFFSVSLKSLCGWLSSLSSLHHQGLVNVLWLKSYRLSGYLNEFTICHFSFCFFT